VLPFLPLYLRTLGVEDEAQVAQWAGVIGGATGLSMAVFAPIWGGVADRYGRKIMVLRSMFCGALVLGLMGFARGPIDLLVLRLMQGALTGTITASVALVSSVTPARHSGYTLGMMQAAVFGGSSLGPLLGGTIADRFGYCPAFMVAASVLILGGLLVKFYVWEDFTPQSASDRSQSRSFTGMFTTAGFVATIFVLFQIHLANRMVSPIFPLFVESLQGTPKDVATVTGAILSAAGVAAALSAGLFGRLGDTWGHKRLLVVSALVAGILTLPQAFARNVGQLFILRFLFGLTAGAIIPSVNAIIRSISSEQNLGKAYGLTASASCLGMAFGPMAGGYVAARMGLPAPFILTAVLLVVTSAIVLWRVIPDRDRVNRQS